MRWNIVTRQKVKPGRQSASDIRLIERTEEDVTIKVNGELFIRKIRYGKWFAFNRKRYIL